jgi:hypothetical protein
MSPSAHQEFWSYAFLAASGHRLEIGPGEFFDETSKPQSPSGRMTGAKQILVLDILTRGIFVTFGESPQEEKSGLRTSPRPCLGF